MNLRNHTTLCPAAVVAMAALLLAPPAPALTDHLTVVTTNPHTGAPATLELDRYSLRAPNWEARIYSSPTTYTVLPANQVPEVTTYRGRVVEDGGMVIGGVRPNGTLFAKVNYGCRDSTAAIVSDPYESSNRYSWVIWSLQLTGQTVNTGYVYAPAANEPVSAPAPPANWFNNLGATQNFGGPPPYNNMVTMPLNRVRLICSANAYSLGTYGNSIAYALLGMESAVNQADYVAARDGGVSYQIQASGIQTYAAGDADISADWRNMAGKYDIMCYTGENGISYGTWVIDYPEDMSGETMVHELGHSLGGPDFCGEQDYQGSMRNTEHTGGGDEMNGVDSYRCLAARANRGYLKSVGYVYYRTPVPTRANQDLVSTNVNTPVSVDVLLNDWNANTTNRADLPIVSFQSPSERGGAVTDLGGGVLRYTPPAGFHGEDVFRYYVGDPSGHFKSLSGVRVLVVDPNTPLVARYPFDETTGVSALDTSGGGRKGTLTGNGSFATDRVPGVGGVGGAIHFSGYVSIFASSPRLTFGNPNPWTGNPTPDPIASYSYDAMDRSQSVSFWYKPDVLPMTGNMDVTHDFHMLYGKHNITSSGFGDGGGIVLGIKNNTLFFVVQMYGPHGNPVAVDSGITPQPGMWYHLVGGIDRENQQVHLYVNGVKYSSAAGALPAGQFVFGSNCANLGGQNLNGGNMYAAPAGAFDDLRIYTKALTSTEVTDLYEAPGMLPANLLAPTAGQTGVTPLPLLSWGTGRARYQHDVYFGTDAAAVAAASVSTPGIYLGRTSNTSRQITGLLDPVRTYFWRIDEVDGSTIGKGAVWQFTTAVRSPACDLLSFNWGGNVGVINGTNVTLVVPYATDLTTLNPTCTVSSFATVSPGSGSTVDFSNSSTVPVPYTVTAQDLSTKVYHATVTYAPPSVSCDMLSFNWGAYSGLINGTAVTLTVPIGADVTALNPACTVSAGATVSPVSGTTRNFNTPQTYTVTAQDGITQKVYTVTVAFNPIIPLTGGDPGEGFAPRVNVFGAVNCNQAGVGALQNVTFNTNAAAFTVSYSLGGTGGSGGTFAVTTSNDTNLNNLLKSGYASGSPGNITVTITGLTPGQEYQMDWLVNSMGATARDVSLRVYRADGTTPLTGSATFRMAGNNTAYDIRQMFTPADTSVKVISSATTTQDWPLLNGIAITYGPAAPIAACDMLGCNWGASSGVISGTAVTLTVPAGTDVTALNPTCTVSANATVSPVSGTTRNFTTPQTYTVTAQDGITQKDYTVTVAFSPVITLTGGDPGEGFAPRNAVHAAVCFNQTAVGQVQGVTFNTNASAVTVSGNNTTTGGGADFTKTTASDTNLGKVFTAGYYTGGSMTAAVTGLTAGREYQLDSFIGVMGSVGRTEYVQVFDGGTPLTANQQVDLTGDNPSTAYDVRQTFTAPAGGTVQVKYTGSFFPLVCGIAVTYTTVQPGYATWAAANGASEDAAADSNHNGMPNGVEYFMGGTALAPATLPPLVNSAGTWTWTIPYDPTAAANYYFQVSTNLQSWTPLSPGNPAVVILTSPARLRLTLPSGMRFCRLVVATP